MLVELFVNLIKPSAALFAPLALQSRASGANVNSSKTRVGVV